MPQRTVILAGGGSGGHVFPALALSEYLITRGWLVFFVTDQRGVTFADNFPVEVHKIVMDLPNPWSGGKLKFVCSIWLFIKSLFKLTILFKKVKANSVVGFGGYPSAASMFAATILRIPSAIHEQNSSLGRVNKLFANRVGLLVFGIEPLIKPCKVVNVLVLGNPIRQSILRVAPVDYSNLKSKEFVILVLGGSQGARFVSLIVCNAIVALPVKIRKAIRVFHQSRQEDLDEVQRKYARADVNSTVKTFFDDVPNHLNAAHLVISRAGASSISEICIFGRPSILIPLPTAVGNHQAENASVMDKAGASIVLDQNRMSLSDLSEKIVYVLKNFEIAKKMSASAKRLSKPYATQELAKELEKLK